MKRSGRDLTKLLKGPTVQEFYRSDIKWWDGFKDVPQVTTSLDNLRGSGTIEVQTKKGRFVVKIDSYGRVRFFKHVKPSETNGAYRLRRIEGLSGTWLDWNEPILEMWDI